MDIQQLNDVSELSYGLRVAADAVVVSDFPVTDRLSPEEQYSIFQVAVRERSRWPPIFIASFCAEGDLLSQWRGYGRTEFGYSLGFDDSELAKSASRSKYRLVECVYDRSEQKLRAEVAVFRFLSRWRQARVQQGIIDADSARLFERILLSNLLAEVVQFKHPGFSEEREWRLVSPLFEEWGPGILMDRPVEESEVDAERHRLRYRGPNRVMYRSVDLPTDHQGLHGTQMLVAPGSVSSGAYAAAEKLLTRWSVRLESPMNQSDIPFRG